jgi:hypothetical protein
LLKGLRAHLIKPTIKFVSKKITHAQDDNVLSKLKESIYVPRILISFLVKYEILKNLSVSRQLLSSCLVPTKRHNFTTKKRNKIRQIFNYVHKAFSGHQATCEQNCGMEYGSLETCLKNPQFSNEKVQSAFENN